MAGVSMSYGYANNVRACVLVCLIADIISHAHTTLPTIAVWVRESLLEYTTFRTTTTTVAHHWCGVMVVGSAPNNTSRGSSVRGKSESSRATPLAALLYWHYKMRSVIWIVVAKVKRKLCVHVCVIVYVHTNPVRTATHCSTLFAHT